MEPSRMALGELAAAVAYGTLHLDMATSDLPVIVVSDDGTSPAEVDRLARAVRSVPAVLVSAGPDADLLAAVADITIDDGPDTERRLTAVVDGIGRSPIAAVSLAMLMRSFSPERSIEDGLVAESTTYSMLQSGPEFRGWRASNAARRAPDAGRAVIVERYDDELVVTLDRPHVRNALNTAMQAELVEALALAVADESIARVVLRGNGPSFSSGGDLDEFGGFRDPATAHLVRLTRSPARLAALLGPRLHAFLHGACAGSGIEIPAFAGRIVAAPDASISLPELRLGLIPGAGGTVSIARRIGRHRTTELVLCGTPIDAATALLWGLVDEVSPAG